LFEVNPRLAGYGAEQMQPLNRRILDTLAALPGVHSVAATDDPDLSGNNETGDIAVAGYAKREGEDISVEQPWITPGYFATTGIPLLAGRDFNDGDTAGHGTVAIVNAALAKRFFGTPQNAIGRRIGIDADAKTKFDIEIVGVAGDTKHNSVRDPIQPAMFRPLLQLPQMNDITYLLRTRVEPRTAEANIRSAMQQLDSKLALTHLQTEDEQIANSLSTERLIALLAVSFGIVAVLLAAIGLYGVLAYSTAQRTREIGIRMALGARRSTVVQLVMRDVLWICGASVVVTLPLALMLGHLLRQQLYGISAGDPVTFVIGTLLVGGVAVFAAMLPARRAASIEPMQALRTE
jgi:predicted permease